MVSLRIQQLLAYESGVTDTVDPLAGSYYVEHLTDEIEKGANTYIQEIDRLGGAPAAIETGYVQRKIQEGAYRYQKEIESGKRTLIGVNKFKIDEPACANILKIDPQVESLQVEKLSKIKAARDNRKVKRLLEELKKAARGDENLMAPILEAVKAYSTLGEICGALKEIFGEYKPPTVI